MLLAFVAGRRTQTNAALAAAAPGWVDACVLTPEQAVAVLGPCDAAVGRLDVAAGLDGVEDGLWALGTLTGRGVRVLNRAGALLGVHDKLLTARVPRTGRVPASADAPAASRRPPAALERPRASSSRASAAGGATSTRCENEVAFRRHLHELERKPWFQQQGVLVQELVEPAGHDLRIVVAAGVPVGAISRVAAAGEWRTNVSLGAKRVPVDPPTDALLLAVRAAAAACTELVGVDLLPDGAGGWTVLELNGAVDFTPEYRFDRDPFAAATSGARASRRRCAGRTVPLAASGTRRRRLETRW